MSGSIALQELFCSKYTVKMHHLNNYIVKYTEQMNMHKMVSSTMQG